MALGVLPIRVGFDGLCQMDRYRGRKRTPYSKHRSPPQTHHLFNNLRVLLMSVPVDAAVVTAQRPSLNSSSLSNLEELDIVLGPVTGAGLEHLRARMDDDNPAVAERADRTLWLKDGEVEKLVENDRRAAAAEGHA